MNKIDRIKLFLQGQPKWKGVVLFIILLVSGFGIFFFTYYKVDTVEVMDSNYYTKDEIKEMVLDGPLAYNSVLAPILYSKDLDDEGFVKGFSVTALSRNTICITVKENTPVGCLRYLDSYVYFDQDGYFTDSSLERNEQIPYFVGVSTDYVIKGEKIPVKGSDLVDIAKVLSGIFQKNDLYPDYIQMDSSSNIDMIYGDITVQLGKNEYLEDKMARVLAILPKLDGEKGILHMENVGESNKTVTFEREVEEITAENWNGGYDEYGEYTGDGEYTEDGKYVGPKPKGEYDYAIAAWPGGYDTDGDYTGSGPYDEDGVYVGEAPTEESIAANGDWKGGYDEAGRYVTDGEYDREGNYVGPRPSDESAEDGEDSGEDAYDEDSDSYDSDSYDEDDEDDYYGDSYYDDSYDEDDWYDYEQDYDDWYDDYGYDDDDYDW
jgi:cell division protein FtsQ